MTKKIFVLIMTLLSVILLVSCKEITSKSDYVSNNSYEQEIINASKSIDNATVMLYENSNNIGSALVYKKEDSMLEKTYYAITSSDLLLNINKLEVYPSTRATKVKIVKYALNTSYDFGVIVFKSRYDLNTISLENYNEVTAPFIGQTVLSIGTDSDLNNIDNLKTGTITNNKLKYNNVMEYSFTHDAAINSGELGTGVFNIKGEFIGLNVKKEYYEDTNTEVYNILGLNTALKAQRILTALKKVNEENFTTNIIPNNYFEEDLLEIKEYEKTELEVKYSDINKNVSDSIVKLETTNEITSGLIYKKNGNNYYILTTSIKLSELLFTKIYLNDKTYKASNIVNINDSISVVRINTSDNLKVYESSAISNNKNVELIKGQFIAAIGSINKDITNSLNTGVLSRINHDEKLFMHNINLNLGQKGAPIFNLNNELIGINLGKINTITTSTGDIIAEGLSYAYDINYLLDEVLSLEGITSTITDREQIKYNKEVEYEKDVLSVIESVNSTVVTVITDSGHGSGIIYKKEKIDSETYQYYVMTNDHVVTASQEIKIDFNDERAPIFAEDYQTTKTYDIAIVRFRSKIEHKVYESKAINEGIGSNYIKGQTVIAIGTPESIDKEGYVTIGNLRRTEKSYNLVSGLALTHTAAINPGNSGGPLFNLNGELIGINVSKITGYQTSSGTLFAERIGTSLNINIIAPRINEYLNKDYITLYRKPRLGITIAVVEEYVLNEELEDNINKLPRKTEGLVIINIDELRDSYNKLKLFDLVIGINGKKVTKTEDVANVLATGKFGDKYVLKILRKDKNGNISELDIEIELK